MVFKSVSPSDFLDFSSEGCAFSLFEKHKIEQQFNDLHFYGGH